MTAKGKLVWYARGGGIAKMGPFKAQEIAAERLLDWNDRHVDGAFVWPEREQPRKKGRKK